MNPDIAPDSMRYGCFDGLRGLYIEMSYEDALDGSHQGSCDADIARLVKKPAIAAQLAAMDPLDIALGLKESGAYSAEDLEDTEQNRHRAVWFACCDIRENAGNES